MSDWRQRQPHRAVGKRLEPISAEVARELAAVLGVETDSEPMPRLSGDGPIEPTAEERLLEQLEAELLTGTVAVRVDVLPSRSPWVSAATLPELERLLGRLHEASSRLDKAWARPAPLEMHGEASAAAEVFALKGIRVGGPLLETGRPRGVRTIPPGARGLLLVGEVELTELVAELRNYDFVVRIAERSSKVYTMEARPRTGSVLFPVRRYERDRAKLARLQERLARKAGAR